MMQVSLGLDDDGITRCGMVQVSLASVTSPFNAAAVA